MRAQGSIKGFGAMTGGSWAKIGVFGAKNRGSGAKIGGSGAKIRGSMAKTKASMAMLEAAGVKIGSLRPGLGPPGHLGPRLVALESRLGARGP